MTENFNKLININLLSKFLDKIKALIPTKTSELINDNGFITSYTETDPTVPTWAKAANKPTYTAAEVGAASSADLNNYVKINTTGTDGRVVEINPYNEYGHTGITVYDSNNTNTLYIDTDEINIKQQYNNFISSIKSSITEGGLTLSTLFSDDYDNGYSHITITPWYIDIGTYDNNEDYNVIQRISINGLENPTSNYQAAHKKYVDDKFNSIPSIPSKTSDLTNDSGFVDMSGAASAAPVQSVNGKTGTVVINASDVGAGTYSKPSGGIPKTDLASDVQISLGKADTALQTAPVQSVNEQTGAVMLDAEDVGALPEDTNVTDVKQKFASPSTFTYWRPLLIGMASASQETDDFSDQIGQAYAFNGIRVQPSTGTIKATTFKGNLNGTASGNIVAPSSPAIGSFLVWNGSAWVAQTLSTWQGGSF